MNSNLRKIGRGRYCTAYQSKIDKLVYLRVRYPDTREMYEEKEGVHVSFFERVYSLDTEDNEDNYFWWKTFPSDRLTKKNYPDLYGEFKTLKLLYESVWESVWYETPYKYVKQKREEAFIKFLDLLVDKPKAFAKVRNSVIKDLTDLCISASDWQVGIEMAKRNFGVINGELVFRDLFYPLKDNTLL
jgi:hypothetical protein